METGKYNLTSVQGKLRALDVQTLYLFGSEAEGTARASSDIDIGVILNPEKQENYMELHSKLYDVLSEVFEKQQGRELDIVFLNRAPLELQLDVIRHGRKLFDRSPGKTDKFEHVVRMKYMDFNPLLNLFNQQILGRI